MKMITLCRETITVLLKFIFKPIIESDLFSNDYQKKVISSNSKNIL